MIRNILRTYCTISLTIFDILLKLIWYIFIKKIFTQRHSKKAVPLIANHINDKRLIMIKKLKMRYRKGFINVNISN